MNLENNQPLINWNALVNIVQNGQPFIRQDPIEVWNKNIKSYIQMTKMETDFTHRQLDAMPLLKEDEVLDCGCGWGRIVVPLAKRVKLVTAMDSSKIMLDECKDIIKKENLNNVNLAFLDFDKVEIEKDIQKHDVVICSKSRGLTNLAKLSSMAKRAVVIVSSANTPHFYTELFKGTSSEIKESFPKDRRVGYNILINQVYDLGFDPNVSIVKDGFRKVYKTKEEAYKELGQLKKVDSSKIDIFKKNVDKYLKKIDTEEYEFLFKSKSVVIWWEVNSFSE